MPHIRYAFRDDANNITLLTQGSNAACPMCQIAILRKREFAPDFLGQLMAMDIKGGNLPASALSEYGRSLTHTNDHRRFYATIDSQIEFIVKPRTMQKLSEFIPAYNGTGLYNFFEGQPYGYLVLLKVYTSQHYIPDALMAKGRMGSAQIILLYDQYGEKTVFHIPDDFKPLIDEGTFDYIKYEILHALRVENALIGVYGTDDESKRLLKQKRDDYNDGTGQFKHTYNEDADVDRAQVDYEETYHRIIELAPQLTNFIDYVRTIKAPQMVEWQTLLPRAVSGDEKARHRIVEMYLRNILRIALYYTEKLSAPIEEIVQDGVIGLITAMEKFDASESDMFQQYYQMWVRQVIHREMPQYLYSKYVPLHIHERILRILELAENYGYHLPEDTPYLPASFINTICEDLSVSDDKVHDYLLLLAPDCSLDELLESNCEDIDSWMPQVTINLSEGVEASELQAAINATFKTLMPREAEILLLRNGFYGRVLTLEEVGQRYGVTRERIRQIETKAIRKLRHPTRARKLKDYYIE